ncbi:MAG: DUF424 family protein [Candidatus Nanoarchaeia archaeon]
MQIKIHEAYRKIVALADSELIGKTFSEDIKAIKITPSFFGGEKKNSEEIIPLLKELQKEDATFNIVGEKSIECALKAGIIKQEGIIKIQDIPIALGLL